MIAKVFVWFASGSDATIVPMKALLRLFSNIKKRVAVTVGASLMSLKETVIAADPDLAGLPLSVTVTVRFQAGWFQSPRRPSY